jgi:hypothetical protein
VVGIVSLVLAVPLGIEWHLIVVLIYISLSNEDLFITYLHMKDLYIFVDKMLAQIFCPYLIDYFPIVGSLFILITKLLLSSWDSL